MRLGLFAVESSLEVSDLFVFQQFLNLRADIQRVDGGFITVDYFTILTDQKFGKVPADFPIRVGLILCGQVLVKRVGILTVHFNFGKNRKGQAVIDLAKLLDLLVAALFLLSELVAWKGQDFQSPGVPVVVQFLEILSARPNWD